jgi:hypothetical protein
MATAATIALSLVIICLTSRVLGQDNLEDDNTVIGRGSIAGGRARIARLRRLQLRSDSTTTGSPVRERTRVRVKAIKSRKQKVNADRRATLAQSKSNSGISSSSPDDTNNRRNKVNRGEETSRKDASNKDIFMIVCWLFVDKVYPLCYDVKGVKEKIPDVAKRKEVKNKHGDTPSENLHNTTFW